MQERLQIHALLPCSTSWDINQISVCSEISRDPALEDPSVLPRPQMRRVVDATRKHEGVRPQSRLLDPLLDGVACCGREFELNRALRLVLHQHGARCHLVAVADVTNLKANEVAAAQLAVDPEVEEGKLAHPAFHLKADSEAPRCP